MSNKFTHLLVLIYYIRGLISIKNVTHSWDHQLYKNLAIYIYVNLTAHYYCSPDKLVQPDCDGVELSNGMTEKILVLCHSRVALNKALGQIVDKKTEGVVD